MKRNPSSTKWVLLLFLFLTKITYAQLEKPEVENVYGGRINYISGYPYKSDTSRIIISTESANSLFYADVKIPATSKSDFQRFYKVKSADDTKNFGGRIRYFQVHRNSGTIFFADQDMLYKTTISASTVDEFADGPMITPFVYGDVLMYVVDSQLYFGALDAGGNFIAGVGSPIILSSTLGIPKFAVDPINSNVYVFYSGTGATLKLYKSSDAYDAFSGTTTFSDITPVTLSATNDYSAMNIAPDGRIFIAGANTMGIVVKRIEYSDDDISWTSVNTGIEGVGGEVIAFSGTASDYHVYYSKITSNNKGLDGSWFVFGDTSFETHPNDGVVYVDPNDTNIVYMTTDQGIGASMNEGYSIFEIDEGVEAVQVMDFDMTSDKTTAWLASKAGIRKVSNYSTSPKWTNAMFPNSDGSPYYSAEMAGDTNVVYVGNVRVYKTINGGNTWKKVFTPEDAPYNWTGVIICEAIEVCQYDTSIVFAGYQLGGTKKGGLFYSHDGGLTWSQIKLNASSVPNNDVDVHDIVFTKEGADTVAYVGVDYDLNAPTGRSIYRVVKSGSNWLATQDMDASNTSTGSLIVASIRDLHSSFKGDTIFAAGTDAGVNHPIAYYKPINSTNKWTPFTTNGFPMINGKQGYAITLGNDTVYVAVDNEVYNYELGAPSWKLGYTYPEGTEINVLYFDELLVGTGTGLYGHIGKGANSGIATNESNVFMLYPNPNEGKITFKFPVNFNFKELEIIDTKGNVVSKLKPTNMSNVDDEISVIINNLSNGVYLIRISNDTSCLVERIIIRK